MTALEETEEENDAMQTTGSSNYNIINPKYNAYKLAANMDEFDA